MSDMMMVVASKIKERPELADVTVKPYYRPESLAQDKASLVIVPMAPPRQVDFGSDKPLRKQFTYQINIEASSKALCTSVALAVDEVLTGLGFYQLNGGIDEYFVETKRFVDARRYRGYSQLYDTAY